MYSILPLLLFFFFGSHQCSMELREAEYYYCCFRLLFHYQHEGLCVRVTSQDHLYLHPAGNISVAHINSPLNFLPTRFQRLLLIFIFLTFQSPRKSTYLIEHFLKFNFLYYIFPKLMAWYSFPQCIKLQFSFSLHSLCCPFFPLITFTFAKQKNTIINTWISTYKYIWSIFFCVWVWFNAQWETLSD